MTLFETWWYHHSLIVFNMLLFILMGITGFRGTQKIKKINEDKVEIFINKSRHSILVFIALLTVWLGLTLVMIFKSYM